MTGWTVLATIGVVADQNDLLRAQEHVVYSVLARWLVVILIILVLGAAKISSMTANGPGPMSRTWQRVVGVVLLVLSALSVQAWWTAITTGVVPGLGALSVIAFPSLVVYGFGMISIPFESIRQTFAQRATTTIAIVAVLVNSVVIFRFL